MTNRTAATAVIPFVPFPPLGPDVGIKFSMSDLSDLEKTVRASDGPNGQPIGLLNIGRRIEQLEPGAIRIALVIGAKNSDMTRRKFDIDEVEFTLAGAAEALITALMYKINGVPDPASEEGAQDAP